MSCAGCCAATATSPNASAIFQHQAATDKVVAIRRYVCRLALPDAGRLVKKPWPTGARTSAIVSNKYQARSLWRYDVVRGRMRGRAPNHDWARGAALQGGHRLRLPRLLWPYKTREKARSSGTAGL